MSILEHVSWSTHVCISAAYMCSSEWNYWITEHKLLQNAKQLSKVGALIVEMHEDSTVSTIDWDLVWPILLLSLILLSV